MNHIHYTRVNHISEFNLLHYILNTSKRTKNMYTHYSPILNICINIRRDKAKIKIFLILFNS